MSNNNKNYKKADDHQIFNMLKAAIEKNFSFAPTTNIIPKGINGPYCGVNALFSSIAIAANGWDSDTFLSLLAINKKGGKIKKGSKATIVVFYDPNYKLDDRHISAEYYNQIKDNPIFEGRITKGRPYVNHSSVFNLAQTTGIDYKKITKTEIIQLVDSISEKDAQIAERLQTTFLEWEEHPKLIPSNEENCAYLEDMDVINFPTENKEELKNVLTFAHEIIKSTGTPKRLNRYSFLATDSKNSTKENIVAQLGANLLLARLGAGCSELKSITEQSAIFMKTWLTSLATDKVNKEASNNYNMFIAFDQALKAVECVMNQKKSLGGLNV